MIFLISKFFFFAVPKEEDSENNNKMVVTTSPNNHKNSRKPNLDWQITKQNLSERGQYLLETGIWSDCTFVVGLPPNLKVSTYIFFNGVQ